MHKLHEYLEEIVPMSSGDGGKRYWTPSTQTQLKNGRWVGARPLPYKYFFPSVGWFKAALGRAKDAWEVFMARADAVKWE